MTDQNKSREELLAELAELRRQEAQWRSLVMNTPIFVALVDRAGTMKYLNHSVPGFAAEDAIGMSAYDFMEPGYRQIARECIERVLATGQTTSYELVAAGPHGGTAWYETYVGPVRVDGQIVAVTLISSDITRRKQAEEAVRKARAELERRVEERTAELQAAIERLQHEAAERRQTEEALRQSHDELRAIYDQMADGIIIVDAEKSRPMRANSAYCRMLGYSQEEAYSLTPERVHPPEVLPRVWEHLEAAKEGLVARIEDVPFLRKDGSVIYADVVSSRIFYNERPGWISFFHEVTERKHAQEALQREHRALKHLLQSSDHERQLIAYEIHDGLAQQLAAATMQFETFAYLKDRRPKEAADAFQAGLTMLRQGHHETRRLIAGVRPPILDESGVAEAIAHLVHEQGRDQGPKIEFRSRVDLDRFAPSLENAIYRITQEALANACQHSKSDEVRVSFWQRGERVRIKIQDWGIGFDPRAVQGNRFGLEGVRQRARLLGGKCSIRSAPGKGASITVEFPMAIPNMEE